MCHGSVLGVARQEKNEELSGSGRLSAGQQLMGPLEPNNAKILSHKEQLVGTVLGL